MSKQGLFILGGVLGVAVLIALSWKTPTQAVKNAEPVHSAVKTEKWVEAKAIAETTPAAETSPTATPTEKIAALPPHPEDEAPQAVLDWSTDLGRGMLTAFREPAQADKMFSFLRNCAEDKSLGLTYRAVCAGNAKRLADRFPEKYSQNFSGFQRGLPERIQKFLSEANTKF